MISEYVRGLAAAPPGFFWVNDDCDPDIPVRNAIRVMQPAPPGPFQGGFFRPRTLVETPCWRNQVISRNIAVDDRYVYWVTADRFLLRKPHDGSAPADSFAAVTSAPSPLFTLAVADGWLVWSDGAGVYRKRTGPMPPAVTALQVLLRPSADTRAIRDLLPAGDGYALRGQSNLQWLVPIPGFAGGFFPLRVADGVTAFAADSGTVYMAQTRNGGGYVITAVTRGPDYGFNRVQRYVEIRAGLSVDHIAVDGTALYWHVADRNRRGMGPLLRQSHARRDPVRITSDIEISPESRLTSSAAYLSWANREGFVRLPTNASSLGSP
jgi:hypothetical protein